jgi:hypothetical protein
VIPEDFRPSAPVDQITLLIDVTEHGATEMKEVNLTSTAAAVAAFES